MHALDLPLDHPLTPTLQAIVDHLMENDVYAHGCSYRKRLPVPYVGVYVETLIENGAGLSAVNCSVVDGAIRIGGEGVDNDIPLSDPDSLDELVRRLKIAAGLPGWWRGCLIEDRT